MLKLILKTKTKTTSFNTKTLRLKSQTKTKTETETENSVLRPTVESWELQACLIQVKSPLPSGLRVLPKLSLFTSNQQRQSTEVKTAN